MDEIERCFTRNEDEFFLFLQDDIGGAQQDIFAITMGDPAEGPHAAREDDHGVGRVGTAGKGRVHALQAMSDGSGGEAQAARQFFADNGLGVSAQDNMEFVLARVEVIQQTLSVEDAAGSGYGNEDSQGSGVLPCGTTL